MSSKITSRRINELAKKWKEGTITPEEKKEFDGWYENPGGRYESPGENPGDMEKSPDAESLHRVEERIFQAIADRTGLQEGLRAGAGSPPSTFRVVSMPRHRRALAFPAVAAAILIFLLGGVGWLYYHLHERPTGNLAANHSINNAFPPGTAKATLTLSDGTLVPLQKEKNTTIRDRSGVSIQQQGGQLVYGGGESSGQAGNQSGGQPVYDGGQSPGPAPDEAPTYNTISVPRGGQYQLVLSDGTAVWLNSASTLRYPTVFRGDKRTVTLTGEGYFEVAKDKDHVFQVVTGEQVIDVLGTSFNVNCYADEENIKTTLLEGKVRVQAGSGVTKVEVGQQAVWDRSSGGLRVADHADLEQAIAWKNGYFQLSDADIRTIMRQVARWYDVEVVYEGAVPERQLSGKMRRSASAAQFLDMLSYFNIHFRIEGRKIIVMAEGGAAKTNN